MKIILLILFLFIFNNSFVYSNNIDYSVKEIYPGDTTKFDSTNNTNIYPVNIFYEFLGSSIWMSLNYQQTIFSKKNYSLDFLTGINNWEFGAIDFVYVYYLINSHFFLLNRFSNKTKRFFIEFGPGFKLESFSDYRSLKYDISWNTSIMKVFKNNLFVKFNTTFSTNFFHKRPEDPNSEATLTYGYAFFPIGISIGYRFADDKPVVSNNIKTNMPRNIIGINSIIGLNYERLLYKKNNNGLYFSINPNFYVYKKYNLSEKYGYLLFERNFINYVQQVKPNISTEFGIGFTYYKEKFSIFKNMFSMNTNEINLNMGIRIMPMNHFIIKVNYSPIIWASNENIRYLDQFIYYQLDQTSYFFFSVFFITLGYAW